MRGKLLAAVVVLLAAAPVSIAASPAGASPAIESCSGTVSTTYNPAATSTPQYSSVRITSTHDNCLGSDTTLTSGLGSAGTYTSVSCAAPLGTGFREGVDWNNGNSSVLSWVVQSISNDLSGTVVTLKGVVLSGEFAGALIEETNTYLLAGVQACDSPQGMSTLSGTTALFIQKTR